MNYVIRGKAVDGKNSGPLSGAQVEVVAADVGNHLVTDNKGEFATTISVADGAANAKVTVSKLGFITVKTDLTLSPTQLVYTSEAVLERDQRMIQVAFDRIHCYDQNEEFLDSDEIRIKAKWSGTTLDTSFSDSYRKVYEGVEKGDNIAVGDHLFSEVFDLDDMASISVELYELDGGFNPNDRIGTAKFSIDHNSSGNLPEVQLKGSDARYGVTLEAKQLATSKSYLKSGDEIKLSRDWLLRSRYRMKIKKYVHFTEPGKYKLIIEHNKTGVVGTGKPANIKTKLHNLNSLAEIPFTIADANTVMKVFVVNDSFWEELNDLVNPFSKKPRGYIGVVKA